MFQASSGFQTQYHDLTLIVALDFDRWKILLSGPGIVIDGGRQADRVAAQERACLIAKEFVQKERGESPREPSRWEWTPIPARSWLYWQAESRASAAG